MIFICNKEHLYILLLFALIGLSLTVGRVWHSRSGEFEYADSEVW